MLLWSVKPWSDHMNSQDIVLSEEEQTELSRRIRSATISQRDGRRARVTVLAARGCSRNEIAQLTDQNAL